MTDPDQPLDLAAIASLRGMGLTRREHVDLLIAEVLKLRATLDRVKALGAFDAFMTVAPMVRVRAVHEHDLRAAIEGP